MSLTWWSERQEIKRGEGPWRKGQATSGVVKGGRAKLSRGVRLQTSELSLVASLGSVVQPYSRLLTPQQTLRAVFSCPLSLDSLRSCTRTTHSSSLQHLLAVLHHPTPATVALLPSKPPQRPPFRVRLHSPPAHLALHPSVSTPPHNFPPSLTSPLHLHQKHALRQMRKEARRRRERELSLYRRLATNRSRRRSQRTKDWRKQVAEFQGEVLTVRTGT